MFYRTKVKSIFPGGIIDAHNKRLVFVGNKLARVGDLVWTDGSVVLGHTPIRGGAPIAGGNPDGVPVLCDNLQGYFDTQGKFHSAKLPVSGSDRFVNDDKYFCKVPDNAVDAEIAVDADGKPDGVWYGISQTNNAADVTLFKNGQQESNLLESITHKLKDIVAMPFFFLGKQGDVKALLLNRETEYPTVNDVLWLYENNTATTVPKAWVKYRHHDDVTEVVASGGDFTMSVTLPDGYRMAFNVNTAPEPPARVDDVVTIESKVDIYGNENNPVIAALPVTAKWSYSNVSCTTGISYLIYWKVTSTIVYFGLPYPQEITWVCYYLSGMPTIRLVLKLGKCCLIATNSRELWKYTETDGLTLVGTGLKNFRLRSMKNVLHAKVIT